MRVCKKKSSVSASTSTHILTKQGSKQKQQAVINDEAAKYLLDCFYSVHVQAALNIVRMCVMHEETNLLCWKQTGCVL